NAEVALYFKGQSDAVVSNGLFSNCNYGIRVEGNITFNHPISGNRFITEQFFPDFACATKYTFVNNNSTYGIYSTGSRFLQQVSHNEFINSKGTDWPSSYGVYQLSGGGVFSENTFTDLGTSVYLQAQQFYSSIENNEIEVNLQTLGNFTSIYIIACQGPVIEIVNNELTNNYNQFISFSAIYTYASTNLSIVNNEIEGFNYGIIDVTSTNHQISNNVISNTQSYGIYVYELPGSVGFITCNVIKMRNFNTSYGLVGYNLSSLSEVSSNCISDCYTSMNFYGWSWGGNTPILPMIRNNFLYNYNYVGINVQGYSGNIGTINDPGLNTLWSNNNLATDINSNGNITVADNFGMFNISFPQVQITSNNPYHSTASCAHQIFNMPSQGNLNINYDCDNFGRILDPLSGAGGQYNLSPGYRETLKSSVNQFENVSMILASLDDPDIDLLNELIEVAYLSENQKALLKYHFFYRNGDYSNARMNLEMLIPENTDEIDFKTLALYELDVEEHGWEVLTIQDIEILTDIMHRKSVYSNTAISLLNNISGYRDYFVEEPVVANVIKSDNIRHIDDNSSYLNIYPNPVSNSAFIELVNNTADVGKISIFEMNGKLVTEYNINFVAGGIELDIRQLKAGVYFVAITDAESGFVRNGKMVKVGYE
nr:T9SS type A sorting domain-containing protein [Bacteroidota bacterium]